MLIDDVVSYCDNEYRNHVCEHCSNEILCDHDCKKCLDDLHYHNNRIRTDYSCEHLLDYYECRYSYKYCSEMIYALNNVDLSGYPRFNILSLGCGGAPDLMAFDYLNPGQIINYRGIDINTSWEKIHNFIESRFDNGAVRFFRGIDVLNFFKNNAIEHCNVICIEYLISFFYSHVGERGVRSWFRQLAEQIVSHKPTDLPMLIIINDADSINTGRDAFPIIREEIEKLGLKVISEYRCRFKEHNHYAGSIRYSSQANVFSIPEAYKDQYKVAIRCEGAQLILEVK